jgi:putative peptidoglycan lipid II flippase
MSRTPEKRATSGSGSIVKATAIMMVAIILSRLTGQIRDILAVNRFGYGALADAYFQGFLIPDFLYEILIGGSIQAAIVPTLSAAIGKKSEKKTWRSVSIFISFAILFMLCAVLIGELFAPQIMLPFTRPDTHRLAVGVSRRLFPQTFFMMLAALTIGILNSYRKFTAASFGPVIYNIMVVMSLLFLGAASESAVLRVAVGIAVSALLFFLFEAYMAKRELLNYRFALDWRDRGARKIFQLAVPTLISSSIPQINNIILNIFMKNLPAGTPASLKNATALWMLPWGIFAVSVGNVMLPTLSRLVADRQERKASALISTSLRRALYLTVPCAVSFFFLRYDLARAVFKWGSSYTEQAVQITGDILAFFCLTIVTHTVVLIMNQSFYAVKKTFMPLLNSVLSLSMTSLFGYFLSDPTVLGHRGLSLGYALGSLIGALFLTYMFARMFPRCAPRRLSVFVIKEGISCFGMVLVLIVFQIFFPGWNPAGKIGELLWLAVRFALAFGAYIAISYLLDMQEIHGIVRSLSGKFRRRSA